MTALTRRRRPLAALATLLTAACVAAAVFVVISRSAVHETSAARREVLTAASLAPPAPGRLTTVHFYSAALHKETDYLVYLPREYTPSQPEPVFYLLHGMPGMPLAFTVHADLEQRLERLIAAGRARPMILVFPDGRVDGRVKSDSEWANTVADGDYQSYVVNVVNDVDHRFATIPNRADRAIAGLSAGAYGATNVGLHEIQLFGLIQSWGGYFRQWHEDSFERATQASIDYNSPLLYVRGMRAALRRYPLRAFLYSGRHDGFHSQTPPMGRALLAEGAQASWAVWPGGHSWQLWDPRSSAMLLMASHDFAHPLPVPAAKRTPRRPA